MIEEKSNEMVRNVRASIADKLESGHTHVCNTIKIN